MLCIAHALCHVCAFVLLRCFSCSHTVLPKEHSLGIIFFSSLSSCKCCIFLQFYLHFTTDYTCMIVYVTNNKEPEPDLTHARTHTHTEQWAAIYAVAPREQLGVRCLAQGYLIVLLRVERALYIHSPHLQYLPARDSNSQPLDYESDSNH